MISTIEGNNQAQLLTGIVIRYAPGRVLIESLSKLKSKYPNIRELHFGECGLKRLADFDKLQPGLTAITVETCNAVTELQFWRYYLIAKVRLN